MTTDTGQTPDPLQSLPFGALIGGPLDAAAKAQLKAAKASWDFIQKVGAGAGTVTVSYDNNGQAGQLQVPLLPLIPVPAVAQPIIGPGHAPGSQAMMRSASGNAGGLPCPACQFQIRFSIQDLVQGRGVTCPSCGLELKPAVPVDVKSHLQEIARAEELLRQAQASRSGPQE